jgi:hypothetical protein
VTGPYAPMKYGLTLAAAVVVPTALFNLTVEGDSPSPPVRIGRNVQLLEIGALFVLVLSVAAVGYLAWRRGSGLPKLVASVLVQAAVTFFVAWPVVFFTQGGALFGPVYLASAPARGGGTLHVFGDGCVFEVYLQRPWSLTMQRVDKRRDAMNSKDVDGARLNDDGSVDLLGAGGAPLKGSGWCRALMG